VDGRWTLVPTGGYYFGKDKKLVDAATADEIDPDVVEVNRLFDELPGVPKVGIS
jgi:hypothetical protein